MYLVASITRVTVAGLVQQAQRVVPLAHATKVFFHSKGRDEDIGVRRDLNLTRPVHRVNNLQQLGGRHSPNSYDHNVF